MLSLKQVSVVVYSNDELFSWVKGHVYWQRNSETVTEAYFIPVFVEKMLNKVMQFISKES